MTKNRETHGRTVRVDRSAASITLDGAVPQMLQYVVTYICSVISEACIGKSMPHFSSHSNHSIIVS